MKIKLILILTFLTLNSIQVLGMGLGDWRETTANGTVFDDPGGGIRIYLKDGKEFQYGDEWYFYKNHIVGKGINWDARPHSNNFFIINEKTVELKVFEKQSDWEKYIHDHDLNPKFWKRSFEGNWNHIDMIKLYSFLYFPISIPIIIFIIYSIIQLFKADDEWRKWLIYSLIVPAILLILNFMGNHPQSI